MDFQASARGTQRETALNEVTSMYKNVQAPRPSKSTSGLATA
jgi:hypothetical protein